MVGFYVDPPDCSKVEWLDKYGELYKGGISKFNEDEYHDLVFVDKKLPVCLVDNGLFKAAGIGFSLDETSHFNRPDGRSKIWYIVPIENLKEISNFPKP